MVRQFGRSLIIAPQARAPPFTAINPTPFASLQPKAGQISHVSD
jgi:hypothetical protein